jgi:hypothetical protein
MYIVLSSNQKYDYHINRRWSLKIFKNGTERRKARRNFGNVIVYLFVDMYVPILYRVMSSSTKSTTLAFTDIGFQKDLSKWNRTPKGSSIFGNTRAYLFVGTIVTIMYRVKLSSTKSTIITSTDVGSSKIFKKKNGTERRKARQILRRCDILPFRWHIVYRVVSPLTKSTTLAFIDIGSLQNFQKKMEPHAERLVGF